jgi:hypothetical protein
MAERPPKEARLVRLDYAFDRLLAAKLQRARGFRGEVETALAMVVAVEASTHLTTAGAGGAALWLLGFAPGRSRRARRDLRDLDACPDGPAQPDYPLARRLISACRWRIWSGQRLLM